MEIITKKQDISHHQKLILEQMENSPFFDPIVSSKIKLGIIMIFYNITSL